MKIELIFVCYNRLAYTKLSLASLLTDPADEFSLTIWDNASTDGTQDYLSTLEDPRITRKVYSRKNVFMRGAAEECFDKSSADVVGVLGNDFLFTPGWTKILAQAHADVPEFGQISCWHLGPEYFDEARARHKIQSFGTHQVLRHPWTDGTGIVKLKTVRDYGVEGIGGTTYGLRLAREGYVNGFYFPLIYAEHMDYPWSDHYAYPGRLEEGIEKSVTYKKRGIRTIEDAKAWHQVVVRNILDDPWEVKYYLGWRKKLKGIRRRVNRILGRSQDWQGN